MGIQDKKKHMDGSICRWKARIMDKGFHQYATIDYFETFSPIVKPITIGVLLTLAISNVWDLRHIDINNVFFCGVLNENVLMEQTYGFIAQGSSHLVCKLKKALYGLIKLRVRSFNVLAHSLHLFVLLDPKLITLCLDPWMVIAIMS